MKDKYFSKHFQDKYFSKHFQDKYFSLDINVTLDHNYIFIFCKKNKKNKQKQIKYIISNNKHQIQ